MENLIGSATPVHLDDTLEITLLDWRGRVLWVSRRGVGSPLNGNDASNRVADPYRGEWRSQLKRCVVDGESSRYTVMSAPLSDNGPVVVLQGTMLPFDCDLSQASVCTVAHVLPPNINEFSPQEIEVLSLLANDKSLRQIATELLLTESAIDARIRKLKTKLSCRTIAGMVAKAIRLRLI